MKKYQQKGIWTFHSKNKEGRERERERKRKQKRKKENASTRSRSVGKRERWLKWLCKFHDIGWISLKQNDSPVVTQHSFLKDFARLLRSRAQYRRPRDNLLNLGILIESSEHTIKCVWRATRNSLGMNHWTEYRCYVNKTLQSFIITSQRSRWAVRAARWWQQTQRAHLLLRHAQHLDSYRPHNLLLRMFIVCHLRISTLEYSTLYFSLCL